MKLATLDEHRLGTTRAISPPAAVASAPTVVLFLDHTAELSGGEIALLRLINALDRTVVTPIVVLAAEGPLAERLRTSGVQTVVLPLSENVRNLRKDTLGLGSLRKITALIRLLIYAVRIGRFARHCGAQIIHSNSLKSDIYGGLAGWLARRPVIWHVRDHINTSYLPAPAVVLFRWLAARVPTVVVTNSQSTLDELHLRGRRPTAIVPSGIPFDKSDKAGGDVDAPLQRSWNDPPRIGIVGRIARWKGQHIFLQAAAKVIAAGGRAEFVIIGAPLFGEEAYERELRTMVEELRLTAHVRFLGFQKDVPAVLRTLDILIHASVSPEPFGQVVVEGMAEALPVIATNGGGVREIILHEKNGVLVPMGDADALAGAITALLANPQRAHDLGAAGYRWVRRHFSAAQSARRLEHVYRTTLRATSPS